MYKAKVNFSGVISMSVGDVAEIADTSIANDLLKAGYIVEVKPAEKAREAAKPTAKRTVKKR